MTDLQQAVNDLQARLADARRRHAHAEAAHDAAQAQYAKLTTELEREYGIETIDEARNWLATATRDLDALISDMHTALDQAKTGETA